MHIKIQSGFSMVEMMVAFCIFIVIIGAVVSIFVFSSKSGRDIFGKQQALESSRDLMEEVTREIAAAAGDTIKVADSHCVGEADAGSGACLIFKTPGQNAELPLEPKTMRYYLFGTALARDDGNSSSRIIISSSNIPVESLSFYIPASKERVTIFMRVGAGDNAMDLQTTVWVPVF